MTDTRPHDEAEALLPWYVTGRLDAEEQALVEAHLAGCAALRAALAGERALARLVKVDEPAGSADAGWAALAARIAAPTPPVAARRATGRPWQRVARAATRPRVLAWVVAAQFALVSVLTGALVAERRPGAYRALGDATGARFGNALVMFEPQVSEARFRQALQASRARLVDGPTSANAYVLALPDGEVGAGLTRLRAAPGVTMAEPIDQAPAE